MPPADPARPCSSRATQPPQGYGRQSSRGIQAGPAGSVTVSDGGCTLVRNRPAGMCPVRIQRPQLPADLGSCQWVLTCAGSGPASGRTMAGTGARVVEDVSREHTTRAARSRPGGYGSSTGAGTGGPIGLRCSPGKVSTGRRPVAEVAAASSCSIAAALSPVEGQLFFYAVRLDAIETIPKGARQGVSLGAGAAVLLRSCRIPPDTSEGQIKILCWRVLIPVHLFEGEGPCEPGPAGA